MRRVEVSVMPAGARWARAPHRFVEQTGTQFTSSNPSGGPSQMGDPSNASQQETPDESVRALQGFTLLELLVAPLIFGIFSALAYAGSGAFSDGRQASQRD